MSIQLSFKFSAAVFASLLMFCATSYGQVILSVSDAVTVDGLGNVVPIDPVTGDLDTSGFTAPAGPAAPTTSNPYQYVIRERSNVAQTDRIVYSFFEIDTSALTLADVQDPNFTATFQVDYEGHLNSLNAGFDVGLGAVGTAWDSVASLPSIADGQTATSLGPILAAIDTQPNATAGLTLDITSTVQGWVDGSIVNNGLSFTGGLVPQAAYFSDIQVVTDNAAVPEPSSAGLLCLAITGLVMRRKRS